MENTGERPSKVYVDSVRQVSHNGKAALKIFGNYPDGCTYLKDVSHRLEDGDIHLELSAFKKNMMCTQMLVPFSFVYEELPEQEITGHSRVLINGTAFQY